ncbi:hypothetical protein Tco_1068676 [Tanacetum coccineum]|uniref:Uncharacterized protein n=1 Tax=Tanacetum coccineum TaxID=301880 RepID=A0ABQ5HHD5_9ASTR
MPTDVKCYVVSLDAQLKVSGNEVLKFVVLELLLDIFDHLQLFANGWKLDGYQADGRSCVVLKMVLVGQMDSPPQSPNHVFNFPENEEEFEEDPQEDPEEEMEEWDDMDIIEEEEEDPEEDPEEWDDVEAVEQVDEIPHPVTPPRNPTAVPHSSPEQSSESEDNDLANSDEAQDVSPPKSTYEIGSTSNAHATVSAPMIITSVDEPVSQVEELSRNVHYLLRESGIKGKEAKVLKTEMKKLAKHMDSWDKDFKNEWLYTCKLEKKLCEVEDKVEKKEEEKVEMKKYVTELERMKECMEEMKGKWELMDY